jgi:hypothetical protein
MGVHDTFPVDAENKSRHHHALGVLGLKFMRLSSDSAGPVEIRGLFDTLQKEEVDDSLQLFASIRRKMEPRKSSMMRAMNRRLIDTVMLYHAHESMRRLSISGSIKE